MKEKIQTNSSKYLLLVIVSSITIFLVSYLLYTTISITSNIRNNSNILEENNSINIYEQTDFSMLYEIASYSTKIYDNDKNRIHNITLGCNTLNGYIIPNETEFSFNNTLGKMEKEDGYKKAVGFDSNGNKTKMYGGGICQLSSTLYNAALGANLKITERHAHSRRVNYVPKDKDATVYYGGPDFKFINNYGIDIVVYATTDGNTVNVSLMIEMEQISKPLM